MGKFRCWLELNEGVKRTSLGKVWTGASINQTFFRDLIDKTYGAKFLKINNVWHMWSGDHMHEDMYEALTGKMLDIAFHGNDGKDYKLYVSMLPCVVEKDFYEVGSYNLFGGGHLTRNDHGQVVRTAARELKDKIFMPNDKVRHK